MASDRRTLEIAISLRPLETIGRRKIEGEFSYSHGSARVKEGDRVFWSSTDGPFAVHFGQGSPFDAALISSDAVPHAKGAVCGKWVTTPLEVREGNIPQGLHYVVAMCRKDPEDPDRDKVFIDSCPVILDEC